MRMVHCSFVKPGQRPQARLLFGGEEIGIGFGDA
jgi:hypothetical protein